MKETPQFVDHFAKLENYLPENMTIAWGRGTQSFWEVTYRPTKEGSVHLFGNEYADKGEQLTEDQYNEGLCAAQVLADDNYSVHYVRYDHQDHVVENWNNAPFRDIQGHSWHKIPQHELDKNYVNIDGQWYFGGDLT